jgi:hypothetical protein
VDVVMTQPPELLVRLDTAPVHRAGYPMLVAVTVENPLPQSTYYALPKIDRFDVPPPLELLLTGPDGGAPQVLPGKTPGAHEGEPEGMRLGPGEMVRTLIDLSELHPRLSAGPHTLTARYLARPLRPQADPVSFVVEMPGEDEARAIAKLRASNRPGAPSWNAFLLDNFREVDDEELADLGDAGRAQLGHTRMLHQAIYGPEGAAQLDPKAFDGLGAGALTGETMVLEHELLAARRDPGAAALEQRILSAWPGLEWRVRENYADDGLVTRLRRVYGADRAFPVPPSPLPYEGARP